MMRNIKPEFIGVNYNLKDGSSKTILFKPPHRKEAKFFTYEKNLDYLGMYGTSIDAYYITDTDRKPLFSVGDVLSGSIHKLLVRNVEEPRPITSKEDNTIETVLTKAWVVPVKLIIFSDDLNTSIPQYLLNGKYLKIWDGKSEFEVWSEGYAVTGESGKAVYHGLVSGADSLIQAAQMAGLNLDTEPNGNLRVDEHNRPSIWACRIYDNEADARKGFG